MGGCTWAGGEKTSVSFVTALTIFTQWWDAMEQTNRPHGWAFKKITNGVIRDMKLWKASDGLRLCLILIAYDRL